MEIGKQGVRCSRETPPPHTHTHTHLPVKNKRGGGTRRENNRGIGLKKRAVGSATNGKEIGAGVGWGRQTGQINGAKWELKGRGRTLLHSTSFFFLLLLRN